MNKNLYGYIYDILAKPEIIFTVIALFFGCLFLFLTPMGEVPDEYSHLYRSFEVSAGIFYNKTPAPKTIYEKPFENLKTGYPPRNENKFHLASRYSPVMYTASSLGIKTGYIFKNVKLMFYLGRLFNLLLYIILIASAIRITPVFKYHFMFTGLFPMALFEGMSYSADSFNTAFAFLSFAYIFYLIYSKNEITKKDFLLLSIVSIMGAFCKSFIYTLGLFIFLPPFSKTFIEPHKRKYYLSGLFAVTVFLCGFWIQINYTNLNPSQIVRNNPFYLFEFPFETVKAVYLASVSNFYDYIIELTGKLGIMAIRLPELLYWEIILIYMSMFVILGERVSIKQRLAATISFIIFYFIIQYSQFIYWTDIKSEMAQGFQGRYMLALMPLFFIIVSCNKPNFSEKYKTYFKLFLVIFLIYLLTCTAELLKFYFYELGIKHIILL